MFCGCLLCVDWGSPVHRQQHHVWLPAALWEKQNLAKGLVRDPWEGGPSALPLWSSTGKSLKTRSKRATKYVITLTVLISNYIALWFSLPGCEGPVYHSLTGLFRGWQRTTNGPSGQLPPLPVQVRPQLCCWDWWAKATLAKSDSSGCDWRDASAAWNQRQQRQHVGQQRRTRRKSWQDLSGVFSSAHKQLWDFSTSKLLLDCSKKDGCPVFCPCVLKTN